MALSVDRTSSGREYKVRDISLADFGRLNIRSAEVENANLMSCRRKFLLTRPLKGVRVTASHRVTNQAAVLIESLTALGAEVRWCCGSIWYIQDSIAAAIARDSAAVFAWTEETLEDYWWCTQRALDWGGGRGPDVIVSDDDDVKMLIHEGVKAGDIFETTGELPDPASTDNKRFQIFLSAFRNGLKAQPTRYRKMKKRLEEVSKETTDFVRMLCNMQNCRSSPYPTINVNEFVTKSEARFDNLYGGHHPPPDILIKATDVMTADKVAVVCGCGDVGKCCAAALKQAGAHVIVTGIDPTCGDQAPVDVNSRVRTFEDAVSEADIFVITTGYEDKITVENMKRMKNDAIICSIGREIDMRGLETYPGVKRITIKPQTDKWVFPETNTGVVVLADGRPVNLARGIGLIHALQVKWTSLAFQEAEAKIVEMSVLNDCLSTIVSQQAHQVEDLHGQFAEATKDLESGKRELTKAVQRNCIGRTFLLPLLFVLILAIVFLHRYL